MTLEDCYVALGGDYQETLGRLRSARLIQRFVLKFLQDGSYDLLCTSMDTNNRDEAFRAAHTIKGMCQNLGFTRLAESSSALTESLRNTGFNANTSAQFALVQKDYNRVRGAIEEFQAGLS